MSENMSSYFMNMPVRGVRNRRLVDSKNEHGVSARPFGVWCSVGRPRCAATSHSGGMMRYSAVQVESMKLEQEKLSSRFQDLMLMALRVRELLGNNEAKNHLAHGVARRLKIISRCIHRLFLLLPPDAEKPIARDELTDLNISIHALLVNVAGVLEDLAWALAYESPLAERFAADPFSVGLFKPKLQEVMPPKLLAHVTSEVFSTWHREYAKDYRDAVAHHIPPYVADRTFSPEDGRAFEELEKAHNALFLAPQFDYEESQRIQAAQDALGYPSMMMTHALSGKNKARPILFHAQAICDGMTITELLEIAFADMKEVLMAKAGVKAELEDTNGVE